MVAMVLMVSFAGCDLRLNYRRGFYGFIYKLNIQITFAK